MPQKRTSPKKQPTRSRVKHSVRAAVVPHKKNRYQPHLVRRSGLAVVLAAVVIVQLAYNAIQSGSVLGQATDMTSQRLLADTNEQRVSHDLPPLKLNTKLSVAATDKADDMFQNQYWSHISPSGVTPWQWFKEAGYKYGYAGENLAKGFHTSAGVVTAWMNSPKHRENMLSADYQDVGFSVVPGTLLGKKVSLVVALYGAPQTTTTAAVSQTKVLAAKDDQLSMVGRLGVGLQSMTPALLGSIALLLFASGVALFAHMYRRQLPKQLRLSWKRHHGLYKALSMASFVVVLIALYGDGQI